MVNGYFSKVSEDVATENVESGRRRQPHCRFTPPPLGTPANIRIYIMFAETVILAYIFAVESMGLSQINIDE